MGYATNEQNLEHLLPDRDYVTYGPNATHAPQRFFFFPFFLSLSSSLPQKEEEAKVASSSGRIINAKMDEKVLCHSHDG